MNLTGHAVGALIPGIALLGISAGAMHLCRAAIPPGLFSSAAATASFKVS